MTDAVLIVNAGSSSVKFAVFAVVDGALERRLYGQADGLRERPRLRIFEASGASLLEGELAAEADQQAALDRILGWLEGALADLHLIGAGHRVVHGGTHYTTPVRVDAAALEVLEGLCPLAPLHQPHNLAAIRAIARLRPELPQIACFDTAFHRGQPAVAQRFALPREYTERGILRYGFHGLSYESIAGALPAHDAPAAAGRTIVAHLGNGASMCAMKGGRSVASSMGFTALDGLPMGQRCGNLDPGVVLYLLQGEGLSVAEVERLLYYRSGLLGMSGVSADMRRLLESELPAAHEALDYYVYRAQREIGALAAALEGLDALVFTAGIGENAPAIRERICSGLGWLGLEFDHAANSMGSARISTARSAVRAWVIPTDEERVIAGHAIRVLGA
jgi:acetate kinase